ncbi:laccase [Moniliophthora roreri]|nr:laccase [Moniliophthora roreri]
MARIHSLLSFVLLALTARAYAAIGPETDLVISNGVVSPDGFSRGAVLAGGTTIGPLIGDTLKINVVNQLNDNTMLQSTSIHWHGFFQAHTNWADGPAFVNQCPIPHGTSFLYEFPVREQAGTFWYHSHLSTQYCDGLRGPIVIYDPDDPFKDMYDVDDESTVITLADWYHDKAKTLVSPTPDSTLINGLGRWKKGDATELAVIQVQQGKRSTLLLHCMVVPQKFQTIVSLFLHQLEANQPVGNYWIHADPSFGDGGFNDGINSAILRYVGAPEIEPPKNFVAAKKPDNMLNEADLHPIAREKPGAPGQPFRGGVDYALNLHLSTSSDHFAINDVEYVSPPLPVLLQVLSGAQKPGNLLPAGSVYELPANSSIEISITGGGVKGFEHPMHLHGHAFDVVRVAGSDTYNYENPVRRDVVNSGKGGDNVTFRFFTDNPGPWFLHCHIDWHLEVGLAVVFAEGSDDWTEWVDTVPPAWDELCPAYDALPENEL